METVPFENLDIHLGRPIVLDENALFDKIVGRHRGGFCYELNALFSALLRELGFSVTRLSACVLNEDGTFGPDFDHMTLLVELEDRWLADVGFGDSFREPLLLDEPGEQIRDGRAYRLIHDGRLGTMLFARDTDGHQDGYRFSLQPRTLENYAEMCRFHQTSPLSPFVHKRLCSRATPGGRITLSDLRLITTECGVRRQRLLSEAGWKKALAEHFGIDPTEMLPS